MFRLPDFWMLNHSEFPGWLKDVGKEPGKSFSFSRRFDSHEAIWHGRCRLKPFETGRTHLAEAFLDFFKWMWIHVDQHFVHSWDKQIDRFCFFFSKCVMQQFAKGPAFRPFAKWWSYGKHHTWLDFSFVIYYLKVSIYESQTSMDDLRVRPWLRKPSYRSWFCADVEDALAWRAHVQKAADFTHAR